MGDLKKNKQTPSAFLHNDFVIESVDTKVKKKGVKIGHNFREKIAEDYAKTLVSLW